MMMSTLALVALQAAAPSLAIPVRCDMARDCLIQKLVDLQPGPGRRDYKCGTLTTEEHDGVDFRVRDFVRFARGVDVLAAADGIVSRVRDGEADAAAGGDAAAGREAGNGVVVSHSAGWETQYSHLRRGSIRVRSGQAVRAGAVLGTVGLSGETEYPHLHFSIRHAGQEVDPFGGRSGAGCTAPQAALWNAVAARSLAYVATTMATVGFARDRPVAEQARRGAYAMTDVSTSLPLVLWADAVGILASDLQRSTITAPDGHVVARNERPVNSGGLAWFGFAGRPAPAGGWPAGRYTGRYEIVRNGAVVASGEAAIVLR
jgi:murein DD-endopeptidase MepM/ murein hydrolase activator NlpD